jgi:hypothetical protein
MKKMNLILIAIAALTILTATDMVINKTDGTDITIPIEEIENITFATASWNETTVQGITFQWMTDAEYLYGMVTAPTSGWVSVGFDPTNQMQNANIIIGYVESNGTVNIRDDFGTSPGSHASDLSLGGTDNIMEPAGEDTGSSTMISFKIPLDSADQFDRVLVPGTTYPIILGYGSSDNYTSFHTLVTSTEINL